MDSIGKHLAQAVCVFLFSFFFHGARARASSLLRLHDHTQTHHSLYNSSGRVISPVQRRPPAQHIARTTDRHPCPRRNSKPQSQHVSGHRPTPARAGTFRYTLTSSSPIQTHCSKLPSNVHVQIFTKENEKRCVIHKSKGKVDPRTGHERLEGE